MHLNLDSSDPILEVYNGHMGSQFRKFDSDYIPYDKQAKATYHQFLQSGAMGPFLKELYDEEKSADPHTDPHTACGVRNESDGVAKFEASLWRNVDKQFKSEVEAYERLKEVQGALVPRPYAVMRLFLAEEGPAGEATHLDVYAIILQAISGPTLQELPERPSPPSTEQEFTSIVQHAVDATPQLVKWGIPLEDSAPRSVMLDQSLNSQPLFVEFAR
ncbi:hypothetical protein HG530_012647 [Fusarium avenaceum]|nr:hypothetical protein HG530_012647 [Fusarium avenaceum]